MRVLTGSSRASTRQALKRLLQTRMGLEVIGEVSDAGALQAQAEATRPDIVLLDWDLFHGPLENPSLEGSIGFLHRLACEPKVIVLGLSSEAEQASLAAGADAFASKRDPPRFLLTAIYAAQTGG